MQIKMIDVLTGPCGYPNTKRLRAKTGTISNICAKRISTGHPGYGPDGLANWQLRDVPELVKIVEGINLHF